MTFENACQGEPHSQPSLFMVAAPSRYTSWLSFEKFCQVVHTHCASQKQNMDIPVGWLLRISAKWCTHCASQNTANGPPLMSGTRGVCVCVRARGLYSQIPQYSEFLIVNIWILGQWLLRFFVQGTWRVPFQVAPSTQHHRSHSVGVCWAWEGVWVFVCVCVYVCV